MIDLPILHDIKLSDVEKTYLNKALNAGIFPSEIVNIITQQRITNYIITNIVGAMTQTNFKPHTVTPLDIQKAYTIVGNTIKNTIVTFPSPTGSGNAQDT